jgi:hypothetical protein
MFRFLVCMIATACVATAAMPSQALAQKKKIDISQKWSGSVDNEKAPKPEVITSAKGLQAIWKAWKVPGDVPMVDFMKNIVVAVYSGGSKLNMAGANLDDQGNLTVLGFGTRDLRPGFRFVLGVVSRDGIKSVNKRTLPE